jgi:hypothetical protein
VAKAKTSKAKKSSDNFEAQYKEALARELMLLIQLDKTEEKLRKIDNVIPIRSGKCSDDTGYE